jgi:predicted PurR-regulated permease PerM
VAIIQGALGGIGFAFAGVDSPLVWAVLMMAFSLLPFGGTAIVWLPAGIYLLATGEAGAGWFLLIWGAVIVGSSDNFLRPWILYKTGSRDIHPLLLFLAILSGIGIFGISGIVFGPLLLALLTTVMRIYREHWPRDPVTGELEPAPDVS